MCHFNTSLTGDLKSHFLSGHEGKKPYKLEICVYRCSLKGRMKKCINSVRQGKKPFKCEICEYGCYEKCDKKIHITSAHEKKKIESTEWKVFSHCFIFSICNIKSATLQFKETLKLSLLLSLITKVNMQNRSTLIVSIHMLIINYFLQMYIIFEINFYQR